MNRAHEFTPAEEKKIREMADKGKSYTDIARATNSTKETVRYWLMQRGIRKAPCKKTDDNKNVFIQRASCSGCGYRGYIGGCNYILIEGQRRGCPADNCDKYIPKEQLKRRSVEEEEVEDKEMTDEELIEYVNEQETAHNAQEGA